jgi:hypothetical protein
MKTSPSQQLFTLLLMLAVCATIAYGQKPTGQRRRGAKTSASPSRLSGMKIIPYNRMTDTFEDDIADSKEGHLNEIDLSYLVKVEVSGKAGEYSDRSVEITVREGNKLTLTRNTMVGIFNENGKYFVPVWIYMSPCSPTVIQATLIGQRPASTIRKRLLFQCGE